MKNPDTKPGRPFFCSTPAEPFFRPDRSSTAPSCRVAVKDGRAFRGHPKGLVLDGREHDGTLWGFGAEDDQSIDYLDFVNINLPAPAHREPTVQA
jgi:hypothetical protein